MSQSIDPQTDSIEEPRDVVAPPEPAPENAHVAATEDADASAPEDPLASESALARESALAMHDADESEAAPEPQSESEQDEDLTIAPDMHPDLQLLRTQQQY